MRSPCCGGSSQRGRKLRISDMKNAKFYSAEEDGNSDGDLNVFD